MAIVKPLESAPGAPRRLQLSSPATLETIGEIQVQTAQEVHAAVERARKAQPEWAALGFERRAHYLERVLQVLIERQEEFVQVIQRESGKPRTEALMMEIFASCDALSFYPRRAARLLRSRKLPLHGPLRFTKKARLEFRPLGVVGVISPWNGPLVLALNPSVQALVAGNTVVVKPSEVTAFSGALVGQLFEAAGLPEGVFTALTGDGETGAALVESGVDKICFTGSVATGRKVAEACARRLIPCTLELGGKDAMIVCSDADLDRAAGGAVAGAFLNSGHYCAGTERVYAVDSVAGAFTDRVVERVRGLRQGASGEFDVGSIFWQRQLEIVEKHVEDARAKGARVLAGGRRNPDLPGLFYEPTVLADVTHDMLVMREETFGPVLPIMRVRDESEAVELANDSDYGLSANVWTRSRRRAAELAASLEVGAVCVNDMAMTYGAQEAPFGGRKQSGIGQVNGELGLRGFCYAQPVITDRFGGRQAGGQYPYSHKRDEGMARFIRFLWTSPLGRLLR